MLFFFSAKSALQKKAIKQPPEVRLPGAVKDCIRRLLGILFPIIVAAPPLGERKFMGQIIMAKGAIIMDFYNLISAHRTIGEMQATYSKTLHDGMRLVAREVECTTFTLGFLRCFRLRCSSWIFGIIV